MTKEELKKKIEEKITDAGLLNDHPNCDESCTRAYWEKLGRSELVDNLMSLIQEYEGDVRSKVYNDFSSWTLGQLTRLESENKELKSKLEGGV